MLTCAIIWGLIVTLILTNLLLFLLNQTFYKQNYKSTPLFYYLLSSITVITLGGMIGLYTVRIIL